MGALVTAWHNKAPLVVTAGQQTREMLLLEPLLTNVDATALVRPYVKSALETSRAQDAPAALVRCHAMAVAGAERTRLSVPSMDDWDKPAGVTPMAADHRYAHAGDTRDPSRPRRRARARIEAGARSRRRCRTRIGLGGRLSP